MISLAAEQKSKSLITYKSKSRLSLLLVLLILVPLISCSSEGARLEKTKTKQGFFYVSADHRYFNNNAVFTTSRMEHGVDLLNSALDQQKPHVPVYLYFVESSRSHQIDVSFPENSHTYQYLLKNLHADEKSHLSYTTYEEFCNYFFSTDHHWNARGSYQGYTDIIRMLLGDDEPLQVPDEEITLPVIFNGSFALNEKNPVSEEYFSFYRFDHLPAYTTYVNGVRKTQGNMKAYLKGVYKTDLYTDHYEQLYGGCPAQVVYDTNRPDKMNLLVIRNSYSSAITDLIASHYNRTVYIDLRSYRDKFGKLFSLREAISEFSIDQILIFGDSKMFIDVKHIVK